MQGVSIRMFARASQARMHHRRARTQRPCPAVSVAAASLPSCLCPPLGRGVGEGHHTIRFCQQTQASPPLISMPRRRELTVAGTTVAAAGWR